MARVALVTPCYAEVLRPEDRLHARAVLEALGDQVTDVRGICCGQPAFNSGYRDEARRVGRRILRETRGFESVVMPSGSCVSMVRGHLPGLYEGARREAAARFGDGFRELGEYVAAHPQLSGLGLRLRGTVAYHDSCHARRALNLTGTILGLLSEIRDLEVRRLQFEAECCGFGGAFSTVQPEASAAIRKGKSDDVIATGARVVVSTDLSCLSHISTGLRSRGVIETWTLSELLARALP